MSTAARSSASRSWTRVPLALLQPHTTASGAACVRRLSPRTTRTGKAYLDVEVCHREGSATLRVWSDALPAWDGVVEGSAVELTLTSKSSWRPGTLEWQVDSVRRLPDAHPVRDDLLPQCPVEASELDVRWAALVARLSPAGRTLLDVVLDHVGRDQYDRMAAAERMHHACVGGLRWHSVEVGEFALALAEAVPTYRGDVCLDALITGALLHDVGKIAEMTVERGIGIRRAPMGYARYHTTLGPQMVAVACALHGDRLAAAGVHPTLIEHLLHVCESHHGDKKDYGSPSPPRSVEAWLIHTADLASARLRQLADDVLGLEPTADGWYLPRDGRRQPVLRPLATTPRAPGRGNHADPAPTAALREGMRPFIVAPPEALPHRPALTLVVTPRGCTPHTPEDSQP